MKARILPKLLLALTLASVVLSGFDASARGIRVRRYHPRHYRQPYRQPAPPKPQPPPKPKTLSLSATVLSVWVPGKTLSVRDDNTKSSLSFVIAPTTKFIRAGRAVPPENIKPQEHVTLSYQDTDRTLKEVKVTALAQAPPPAHSGKASKPKK